MTKQYKEITQNINQSLAKLRTQAPDVMKGFGLLAQAATQDGALDKKTKEQILEKTALEWLGVERSRFI